MNDTHQERRNVMFLGDTRFFKLPYVFQSKLTNSITPSVLNCTIFECSGSVVSITDFTGGSTGQTIKIVGDGNTTIVHGTRIKTNTGANKLLAADRIYVLTLVNNIWYEE